MKMTNPLVFPALIVISSLSVAATLNSMSKAQIKEHSL